MKNTQVARLLAYVTGMVKQQVLMQNEHLAAENRILRALLPTRLRLTDSQRATLAANGSAAELSKSWLGWQARHHPDLVSETNRADVRRLKIPPSSQAAFCEPGDYRTCAPYSA